MINTPSPTDEDRELIDYLRRCCEQSYGPSAPTMLPASGLLKAADRLESLLSDRAKLEELLRECLYPVDYWLSNTNNEESGIALLNRIDVILNRSTDRGV